MLYPKGERYGASIHWISFQEKKKSGVITQNIGQNRHVSFNQAM